MKYLTIVANVRVPSSEVERSIQELLLQNDRKLLDAGSVQTFKENLIAHINFICQENRRCRPRIVSWFRFGDLNRDFGLSGVRSINFSLYEIKGIAEFNLDKKQENDKQKTS
ncbi:hypothetical protein [Chryseobacterium vrystaatense]|uniref:Uncharacterized protein n=1 Tax=Chryseobacterium vrystaatense TaxID=307480 RepID=A0ABR4UIE7_9FLAO|nr:hypothetical protein [Chryseobacterium vrystaatense]KFF24457.1 hypothetical protein IW16_19230 [Chryseobacterium vrystaatense]